MKIKEILILSLLLSQVFYAYSGKCGLNHVNFKPKINTAMEKSDDLRFLQEKPWEDIKIVADYTFLDSQSDKVEKASLDFAKKITEQTIASKAFRFKFISKKMWCKLSSTNIFSQHMFM